VEVEVEVEVEYAQEVVMFIHVLKEIAIQKLIVAFAQTLNVRILIVIVNIQIYNLTNI